MCFFGGGKKFSAPSVPPPPPVPAPSPVPVPTDPNPVETADQRRKRADSLRQGVMSTVKTSPSGVAGAGADLKPASAGGLYTKTKLGV